MGLLHTPSLSLVFAPRYSYNAVASNSLDAYPAQFCLNWSRCINASETGVTLQLNCPPILQNGDLSFFQLSGMIKMMIMKIREMMTMMMIIIMIIIIIIIIIIIMIVIIITIIIL